MEKKEVKIVGLKINEQLGILQSCQLKFDPNNKLIAIKGTVGSGKTTLQKSLSLATQGSDALKEDKGLYGSIDEEVQLIDGELNVFIGCKTAADGSLGYTIYTKDSDGKKQTNPVIDGVKATPASYLKNLQTNLTWRVNELSSDNYTVQRKLILELFKNELMSVGVVYDKKSKDYKGSILEQLDKAIEVRSEKEYERKRVGGFKNQLEPLGIDVDDPKTYVEPIDISLLEKELSELKFNEDNKQKIKDIELSSLKNKADEIVNLIHVENNKLIKLNDDREKAFEVKKQKLIQDRFTLDGIKTDLKTLLDEGCISKSGHDSCVEILLSEFKERDVLCEQLEHTVVFENGKILSSPKDFEEGSPLNSLLTDLAEIRSSYLLESAKSDSDSNITEINQKAFELDKAKTNNEKFIKLNSYLDWSESNNLVIDLRNQYYSMLKSIDTGVEGLYIQVDKDSDKNIPDIYLSYNGCYDTKYFNNPDKIDRKLSSYSGTQKPIICLLLQSYLLNKKHKSMRYLWIDDVPIDNKTKSLLEKMGEELGVTIIVNITGDFNKDSITDGEILIEGGEVFFK